MAVGLPILGYIASKPRITEQKFLLILWLSWSLASVALMFRLSLRTTIYRRLQSDDFLAILAWILFLANNILWCTQADFVYTLMDAQGPTMPMDLPVFSALAQKFIKMLINFNLLFNGSLWAVKLSFLMFFRNLRKKSISWKIWWCMVLLATVGSWVVTVSDLQHNCTSHDIDYTLENCTTIKSAKNEARVLLIAACMDVLTNLLIMTFPILVLHKCSTNLSPKLCLLALASLVLASVALTLAKAFVTFQNGFTTDVTLSLSLGHIEMALAIIVLCLGSFRQLYISENANSKRDTNTRSAEKPETKKQRRHYPGNSRLSRFIPFLPQRWSITSSTRSFGLHDDDLDNDPEMNGAVDKTFDQENKIIKDKSNKRLPSDKFIVTDCHECSGGIPPSPVTSFALAEALLSGYTSTPTLPQPVVIKDRTVEAVETVDSQNPIVHNVSDTTSLTEGLENSSRCGTWFRSHSNTPEESVNDKDHVGQRTLMSRFARPSRHFKPTLEINAGVDVVRDWRWQFANKSEQHIQKSPVL